MGLRHKGKTKPEITEQNIMQMFFLLLIHHVRDSTFRCRKLRCGYNMIVHPSISGMPYIYIPPPVPPPHAPAANSRYGGRLYTVHNTHAPARSSIPSSSGYSPVSQGLPLYTPPRSFPRGTHTPGLRPSGEHSVSSRDAYTKSASLGKTQRSPRDPRRAQVYPPVNQG